MPTIQLSRRGVNKMIGYEVGAEHEGDVRYYNRFLSRPTVPPGDSGVTVGIGFDCGYNSKDAIRKAWEGKVNGNILAFLISASGFKGDAAKRLIKPNTSIFRIDFEISKQVFYETSLPLFVRNTVKSYPNLPKLNPTCAAIIVGLVYNRGASLVDSSPLAVRRKARQEMRDLVIATNEIDYTKIANCFNRMKRLWDGVPEFVGDNEKRISGLVKRREDESKEILQTLNLTYTNNELLVVDY
jgi:GH24 family phage-related lysozyme (muramidase)